MTLKEMRELAKSAFRKNGEKPTEDYTKIANAGSEHDPKKLSKEAKGNEENSL